MLRATWYEGTAQLLSLTELKSHLFELYFIGWTIKPMKDGRKPEYPEKTLATSFRKCHILQPEDTSPKQGSTHAAALVAGLESRHANRPTTHHHYMMIWWCWNDGVVVKVRWWCSFCVVVVVCWWWWGGDVVGCDDVAMMIWWFQSDGGMAIWWAVMMIDSYGDGVEWWSGGEVVML